MKGVGVAKRVPRREERDDKGVRSGSKSGQNRVRSGSEEGQNQDQDGSEGGEK